MFFGVAVVRSVNAVVGLGCHCSAAIAVGIDVGLGVVAVVSALHSRMLLKHIF